MNYDLSLNSRNIVWIFTAPWRCNDIKLTGLTLSTGSITTERKRVVFVAQIISLTGFAAIQNSVKRPHLQHGSPLTCCKHPRLPFKEQYKLWGCTKGRQTCRSENNITYRPPKNFTKQRISPLIGRVKRCTGLIRKALFEQNKCICWGFKHLQLLHLMLQQRKGSRWIAKSFPAALVIGLKALATVWTTKPIMFQVAEIRLSMTTVFLIERLTA